MEENEVMFEEINCEDADYVIVAYGTSARICQKTVQLAREKGYKLGLMRPITLWPFPKKKVAEYAETKKGLLVVEMSNGQMVEDVQLYSKSKIPVEFFGRLGGVIPTPDEVLTAFEKHFI
jgi:2-oxoglutarate ferredoxin oxidoreductase subunit alpha